MRLWMKAASGLTGTCSAFNFRHTFVASALPHYNVGFYKDPFLHKITFTGSMIRTWLQFGVSTHIYVLKAWSWAWCYWERNTKRCGLWSLKRMVDSSPMHAIFLPLAAMMYITLPLWYTLLQTQSNGPTDPWLTPPKQWPTINLPPPVCVNLSQIFGIVYSPYYCVKEGWVQVLSEGKFSGYKPPVSDKSWTRCWVYLLIWA